MLNLCVAFSEYLDYVTTLRAQYERIDGTDDA